MQLASSESSRVAGFTLIELSIVLVIIGLIVGGILVGQDLIRAAEVRATISQIEKYNTATNTFRGKYGYLPGDINATAAAQFGFTARGPSAGEGDGNGLLEGVLQPGSNAGYFIFGGETAMYWVDLSHAGLIDAGFNTASPTSSPSSVSSTQVANYMPAAKLGRGNYIDVWSGGYTIWQYYIGNTNNPTDSVNYFSISAITGSPAGLVGYPVSNVALTVAQAYNIDSKVDDGLPQSGRVTAMYNATGGAIAGGGNWAAGGNVDPIDGQLNSGDYNSAWDTPAAGGPVTAVGDIGNGMPAGPNSCYDGSKGLPERYSMSTNSGAGPNCALSFRFQ
jgi:prepilin-type N-terminal cleavage/methylation domain-containing protein